MYVFQRIGDAGNIAAEQINTFGQRLINMQNAINRMYERQSMIDHGWVPPIEPYDLADLGTALMEEEHAGH